MPFVDEGKEFPTDRRCRHQVSSGVPDTTAADVLQLSLLNGLKGLCTGLSNIHKPRHWNRRVFASGNISAVFGTAGVNL